MRKRYLLMLPVLLFTLSVRASAEEKIYSFDMGPAESGLMDGFTRISADTAYTKEVGYGWEGNLQGLRNFDRRRPDTLGRDFVIGANATFRMDLPAGEYRIWVLHGDSATGSSIFPIFPIGHGINPRNREILLQGKSVFTDHITWQQFYSEEYFYSHLNTDYKTKDNIWDKYLAPRYSEEKFDVILAKEPLRIVFKNLPVNALIVYPASMSSKAEVDINYLERRRRRSVAIREIKPEISVPAPTITQQDTKRGYQVFSRPPSQPVYPTTIPAEQEKDKPIGLFGSPGEVRSGMLGIYPLRDISNLNIRVDDLKNPDGKTIPSSAVEIRTVRYVEQRIGRGDNPEYQYRVVPFILVPDNILDMEKGVARSVFITVHIPTDASPGVYRGTVKIQDGKTELPLMVRVLPIDLAEDDIVHGLWVGINDYFYYHYWQPAFPEKDFEDEIWKNKERHYRYLKEYGVNSLSLTGEDMRTTTSSPDGKNIVMDFSGGFGKWMDLYKKMGFGPTPWFSFISLWRTSRGPVKPFLIRGFKDVEPLSETWKAGYKQSIELLRDEGKKRGWPEIYIYISDESSNVGQKGGEHSAAIAQVAKEVPGIRTIISVNGPYEMVAVPYVDIIMPNHAFPITKETVTYIKNKHGKELWLYNIGMTRFSYGFYPWRTGAKGRYQWHGRYTVCFPYDDFDGSGGDSSYMYSYPVPDGPPRATLNLEKLREGIYDYRYIRTLELLVDKTQGKQNARLQDAVKEAEELIAEIRNSIDWDIRKHWGMKVASGESGNDTLLDWNDEICDRYRWRIAQMIIQLNGLANN
jgi:hypothetical protein